MPTIDPVDREYQNLIICQFNKYKGKYWVDVVEEDPDYVRWILNDDAHDFSISDTLHEYLTELLEDA